MAEYKLSMTAQEVDNTLKGAVLKTAQTLTAAEKAQVRTNIGVTDLVPNVTTSDNGKFLRVVDGVWRAVQLQVYKGEVTD